MCTKRGYWGFSMLLLASMGFLWLSFSPCMVQGFEILIAQVGAGFLIAFFLKKIKPAKKPKLKFRQSKCEHWGYNCPPKIEGKEVKHK